MKIIAHIYNGFEEKFGIPRQSGIVSVQSRIVFEKEYRNPDALRGLEEYSHIWLLWKFSEAECEEFRPTVRPPRLGGNRRMGVFATRSPFRPNPIGLSSVRLARIERTEHEGTVLIVEGADLLSGTPIYDIKPYLAYADSHPDAVGGFADARLAYHLSVDFPEELLLRIPEERREALLEILAEDPRPAYQRDAERVYGLPFAGWEIGFRVENDVLHVERVEREERS